MNYSLPLEEVLPCLCLQVGALLGTVGTQREVAGLPPRVVGTMWPAPGTQWSWLGREVTSMGTLNCFSALCSSLQVWLEIQDPLRATLCPFSHGTRTWGGTSMGALGHAGTEGLRCTETPGAPTQTPLPV